MTSANRTHGDSLSCEYRSWKMMWSRCRNPKDPAFKNYGGRGITVCQRWESYEAFLSDLGRRPTPRHTLERNDNEGNYEPSNVRWATRSEQLRNRRNNVNITFAGETMCLTDWAARLGLHKNTLTNRIRRGWSVARALTERCHARKEGA